jgi:glycosyltransferase involved in cell wall biosynthesis
MTATCVAFDVGPLHGPRTGIGAAVDAMHAALRSRDDIELRDYLISSRAKVGEGTIRLPIPAAAAHRLWSRTDRPSMDRWLGNVDVVHGTNYVVPPTQKPRLVSVYDCWFLRNPSAATPSVRRAGEVLRRSIATGATIHACSQSTADAVREFFPGAEVVTIALGALNVPTASAVIPLADLAGRPFILSIGTLERRKNVPTLVRAFRAVAASHPEVALVIAGGDGDDRDEIDLAIDSLGPVAASRVFLTGRIDEPTRGWLLRHAAVLAYASLDEGFGFPLLDAMQVGLPIVASDVGSIPELTADAALLSAPHDSEALAAHLLAVLTDSQVADRLTAAGATRWESYSWAQCAQDLVKTYNNLAERGQR